MDRGHRIAASEANFVLHASWAAARVASMQVLASDDLVVVDSGLPCDTFNVICRARLDEASAQARAREAVARFREARRPFSWWVGPGDTPATLPSVLEAEGLRCDETELAMAVPLSRLRAPDALPEGLEVRQVRSARELDAYAEVTAANWTPPDRHLLRFYHLAAPALLSRASPQRFYVGYADGRAACVSELTISGDTAGLYGVATLARYRGRGYASALAAAPLLDARALGLTLGVLQASAAGAGVYRRLGFEPHGEFDEFKPHAG